MAATLVNYVASPQRVYVDQEVTFFVNASSTIPGATLNITIYFDYLLANGSVNPSSPFYWTQALSPASITTTHTYDHIGNLTDAAETTYFQVRFIVNDGTAFQDAKSRPVYVVGNTPPIVYGKPSSTIRPTYEMPYQVNFTIQDYDSDMVTITWDFGDGTVPAVNDTMAPPPPATAFVSQIHTWVVELSPGRDSYNELDKYYILFNMSVKFEDPYGHVVYSNHTVNITPPRNFSPVVTFAPQSNYWSPGFALPLYASATDPEGDPITWTYAYNDSAGTYLTEVYHTDYTDRNTTVWCNVTHTYAVSGTYSVRLYVSDALEPWQTYNNKSQLVVIFISDNVAPGVSANISMNPTNPKINVTLGYAEIRFSIWANDFDGDVLNLTWDFGDGETATNQSVGGSTQSYLFSQAHRYTVAGQYNVTVLIDDNRGHTVLKYKVFNVLTTNAVPVLKSVFFEMSHGVYAAPGTVVNVTIVLVDFDRDPLTLWVNFGDNSTAVMVVLTEFSDNNTVTVVLSHIYNSTGKYNVTFTYTDGVFGPGHNASIALPLEVRVPRENVIRVWDWWDYASLALVILGFAMIFVRWSFLGKFRKELDKKGLSLEEYKTIVEELKSDRNAALKEIDAKVKAGRLDPEYAKELKAKVKDGHAKKLKDLRSGTMVGIMGGS